MKNHFIKDTSKPNLNFDIPNGSLVIYRDGYRLPQFNNVEYINFEEFKKQYSITVAPMFIMVGVNRMINPSNRCDMVNEYLQTMTPNISKISIDNSPFIGEPWRLWFHYSITNTGQFNITYSYAIETEWQHWFYREARDCRVSGDNIKMFIDNTYSDLDRLETVFDFYDVEPHQQEWYEEAKQHIFSKFDSPKLLINNLLKLANKHFQTNIDFDSFRTNVKFTLPDLGVYRFLAEENTRRMKIYNAITQ